VGRRMRDRIWQRVGGDGSSTVLACSSLRSHSSGSEATIEVDDGNDDDENTRAGRNVSETTENDSGARGQDRHNALREISNSIVSLTGPDLLLVRAKARVCHDLS
jgi:hypothetical protein